METKLAILQFSWTSLLDPLLWRGGTPTFGVFVCKNPGCSIANSPFQCQEAFSVMMLNGFPKVAEKVVLLLLLRQYKECQICTSVKGFAIHFRCNVITQQLTQFLEGSYIPNEGLLCVLPPSQSILGRYALT
ncbi:hypothetical protein FKM82_026236 [Ascaphus truei]